MSTIIETIADIFHRRGAESYLGEAVTMAEHMLQGAHIAEQMGENDEMVAAALLHDIGHYMDEFPELAMEQGVDLKHEQAGGDVLAPHFPTLVVDCVRHHVAAKRYLCATEPAYADRLSEASVLTLGLQGGPMNENEVAAFRSQPHLDAIIQVRKWDEAGKAADVQTPAFEHYRPLLERLMAKHAAASE